MEFFSRNIKGIKAEAIINEYVKSLGLGADGLARPLSLLKHSKKEILEAFANYIVALKKEGIMSKDIYRQLLPAYSYIDQFVDDETAVIVNKVYRQRKQHEPIDTENQKVFLEYLKTSSTMIERMDELEALISKVEASI